MNVFATQIKVLEQGFPLYDAVLNKTVIVRGTMMMPTSDSRAHHKLTRLSTSPAIIGACPCCEIQGERCEQLKITTYGGYGRWESNINKPERRTQARINQEIEEANNNYPTPSGVKSLDAFSPVLASFDAVRQNVLCIMHVLCNTIKDLYLMMGNEGNKKMTPEKLALEKKAHKYTEFKSANEKLPFHLPNNIKQQMGQNIYISRDIGVLRNPYTDSHIKSSEWLLLSGDLGTHLVGEHLELHYRGVIQRLFKWMQDIMSFSHTKSELLDLEREIYDILTQFEARFPKYMCSVNFHFLLHIVDYIRDFGPVYNTWNFSGERHFGRWKHFIKVSFSPYCFILFYCNLFFFCFFFYCNIV